MKNTLRQGKRQFNKTHANPNSEIGDRLWKSREGVGLTQWQLAAAVTDLLDLQKIVGGQINHVLEEREHPIKPEALESIRFNLQSTIATLRELRKYIDEQEDEWIDKAIAFILNIEVQVGRVLERSRREVGLTQEQISAKVISQLQIIDTPGPPGRAGISKIERGERRMDLLEAWAIAIVLQRPISALLPDKLRRLLPPENSVLYEWHPVAAYGYRGGSCRQYRSDQGKLASVSTPHGVSTPEWFLQRVFSGVT